MADLYQLMRSNTNPQQSIQERKKNESNQTNLIAINDSDLIANQMI